MKFEDIKEYKEIIENEDIFLNNFSISSLEGSPNKVNDFFCTNNNLTSLEGSPKIITGTFNCSENEITSLNNSPEIIKGGFFCNKNKIISLNGLPDIIGGVFNCSDNNLTSLKGRPKKVETFICYRNKDIINIKEEIIKNQIEAEKYYTDDGIFTFKEIKKEFNKYKKELLLINKKIIDDFNTKLRIKENKKILSKKIDIEISL